ncbi:hypothetical protein [Bacillus safensis]|uniref:hypothetical protein n=1 Tax=Bacillus safensis TaxID=561879 RepID=UPI0020CF6FC8|nr:hypothetical protein [Bacillus safensis]MCP9283666.1 hypothetical protein [Bacillus safensis]
MAIIINQILEVPFSNRNKTYYIENGCTLTNNKVFLVPISILPEASRALVKFKCDVCGKNFIKSYHNISKQRNHICGLNCRKIYFSGENLATRNRASVTCTSCGRNFERIVSRIKVNKNNFCSKVCADHFLKEFGKGRPKVKRFEISCDNCNRKMYKTEKQIQQKSHHFCSMECSAEYKRPSKRKMGEAECHCCKKIFLLEPYKIKQSKRNFCSKQCRSSWMSGSDEYKDIAYRGRSVNLICSNPGCSAVFKRKLSTIKLENFCSTRCSGKVIFGRHNPNPPKQKIEVQCHNCMKTKSVHESVLKKNKYFFCSQLCYQEKRFEITDRLYTMTSIHKKVNQILSDLNIAFENEKQIGLYSLDIYLPSYNVAIEVMGDYWHANPTKYKNKDELNDIQIKTISKDTRKKVRVIETEKIRILYLWENDIKKSEELCKKLILRFVRNNEKEIHSYDWEFDEIEKPLSNANFLEAVYE